MSSKMLYRKVQWLGPVIKKWRILIFTVLLFACLVQLCVNLSQGYVFIPPFELETPVNLATFHSAVKPISIAYPKAWLARDLPYGNHGDLEVIGIITPIGSTSPIVYIAYRQLSNPEYEQVFDWGEARLRATSETSWVKSPLEAITLKGKPAFVRTFRSTGVRQAVCQQAYLLSLQDAYVVQMCMNKNTQSPELESLFEEMIASISF